MKNWSLLLHFYQPPTQETEITRNILTFCYLPLLRMLKEKSGFGLSINISGCLLAQLEEIGAVEFFELVKLLISSGKIEMVNTALDHPLLSTIPNEVVKHQIEENSQILQRLLGVNKTPGFFPPELAVDERVLDLIPEGYTIVDETAIQTQASIVRYKQRYLMINNRKIGEVLRSYPNELNAKVIIEMLHNELSVSASDAELFGHHYVERLQVLSDLIDSKEVKLIKMSEAITRFGRQAPKVTRIKPSTWQNTTGFDLWTKNRLQVKYLKLLKMVEQKDHEIESYERATSSCYLYWLSNWPWWHPGFVEKGVESLKRSVDDEGIHAKCDAFVKSMWRYHKSGKVEKNYLKFDEVKNLEKKNE